MESQQNDQPAFAPAQPTTPTPIDAIAKSNHKRTILALWLMIGPTALIIVTIALYALSNFISEQIDPGPDLTTTMYGAPTLGGMLINFALFIIGATAIMAWLPGLITGIVLLATKKK